MSIYKPHSFPSIAHPPLTEGTFHLSRPVFHVIVDQHPHDRVPPDILHDLLTPKTTAKGTVAARQPKDEERHFWVAQLILYGLPHSTTVDRDGAKEILRGSLKMKDGKWVLPVPRGVKEAEGRLTKATLKAPEGPVSYAKGGTGTGTSASSGHGAMQIGQPGPSSVASTPAKGKGKTKANDEGSSAALPVRKKAKTDRPPSPSLAAAEAVYTGQRTKQTARKSGIVSDGVDNVYIVTCPGIELEWLVHRPLEWQFGFRGGYLWGSLDLGIYEAVLRSNARVSPAVVASGKPIPFTWKGWEHDTGEIRYETAYQTGTITFRHGEFSGKIEGPAFGEAAFEMVEVLRPVSEGVVQDWEDQWGQLNYDAWEEAGRDRWR